MSNFDINQLINSTQEELYGLLPKLSNFFEGRRVNNLRDVIAFRTIITNIYYEGMPDDTDRGFKHAWKLLYRLTNLYQQKMANCSGSC